MGGVNGPTEADIVQWGSISDLGLEVLIQTQVACPNNFKALTDVLLRTIPVESGRRDFFLATTLATAIIRLAAIEGASK